MNTLIPNSYQTPNIYSDLYDFFLTPEESKVINFFIRRILGFEDRRVTRRDRISLTQICEGIQREDGTYLTRGTGLSRPTASKCVKALIKFNFIAEVGSATQAGQEYELNVGQLGSIRLDLLEQRKAEEQVRETQRGQATKAAKQLLAFTSKCDLPPEDHGGSKCDLPQVVNAINQGSKSHLLQVVNAINPQNKQETNIPNKQINFSGDPGDKPKAKTSKPQRASKASSLTDEKVPAGRPLTDQQKLVGALCGVTGLDPALHAERAGRCLAKLRRARVEPTEEIIIGRYGLETPVSGWWWYVDDWRGRRTQRPKLSDIEETWGVWELDAPVSHPHAVNGVKKPIGQTAVDQGIAGLVAFYGGPAPPDIESSMSERVGD